MWLRILDLRCGTWRSEGCVSVTGECSHDKICRCMRFTSSCPWNDWEVVRWAECKVRRYVERENSSGTLESALSLSYASQEARQGLVTV